MKNFMRTASVSFDTHPLLGGLRRLAAWTAPFVLVGCGAIGEDLQSPGPDRIDPSPVVQTPVNFEMALKESQAALSQGKIARDRGLFNIGVIFAHPANPKRDPARAIHSFKTLITEHPRSVMIEQSKSWIEVLEQQQKVADERQKLAEEKRTLNREREMLLQERQKLHFANERSRQLDLEIEQRRRRSLGK